MQAVSAERREVKGAGRDRLYGDVEVFNPNRILPRLSKYLLFFGSLDTTDSSTDVSGEVSEFEEN